MSKARLIITAVTIEGRAQHEVARAYGISQSWVSRLVARYRAEGEAAFQPRSRRPKTNPTAIAPATVTLITELRAKLTTAGLDAGPDTIAWHLAHHHNTRVSTATISRYLTRLGLVSPQPTKRPKASYQRFQAQLPNQCWQADFTHYPLTGPPDGPPDAPARDTEILTWLDDHSRYALDVTAHQPVTGPIVRDRFLASVARFGPPASTLTDNGMVFTTRFAGGRGGRNALEAELRHRNVQQKNSRPNKPTTCGKVERFQQTLKQWLRAQPHPTPPAHQPGPAPAAPGPVRRRLQPAAPPPVPARSDHPSRGLPGSPQSRSRRRPRPPHPRPRPTRPHRHRRQGHPAGQRPPAPHRHRPNPRPNPRPAARPRPPRPRRQRGHRRTTTRADHRPRPRLPAHPPTARKNNITPNPYQGFRVIPIS
jgi:transposase